MKYLKLIGALAIVIAMTACSSGLDGTYSDGGKRLEITLTFESDGNGMMSMYGNQAPIEYTVDGKHVKITGFGPGVAIFNINDDGSLTGMGKTFTKKAT